MKWLGLSVGAGLGALVGKLEAGLAMGLVGFILGLVLDLARASNARDAVSRRIETLEKAVAALSRRLESVEASRPAQASPPVQTSREADASEALDRTGERPMPVQPIVPEAIPRVPPPAGVAPRPVASPASLAQARPVAPAKAGAQLPQSDPGLRRDDKPNLVLAWLTGGNTIARVGLVILFIGLAFLLKYAVEHSLVPPELRVAAVALVGVALLAIGWRLRERRAGYALGLQGGGVAVLYLVVFAAYRLYHLLPGTAAFVLLAAIAVFAAFLAIAQDALVLAVFGTGGGFLAPILASTGQGSHVALFSYYLLLNLGIALVALRKSWRSLNIMGFAFTFFIGLAWGWKFYQPDYLATTEPFLVAFFLLYVAIAILHARPDARDVRRAVDGTIIFGVPLGAFGIQAALMRGNDLGMAYSCVAASALYLALTAALKRSKHERFAALAECFLALGVIFATLAIPFALDERWTSAFWALEGAGIVWVSRRQGRRAGTAFGAMLQVAAGVQFGLASRAAGFPWLDATFIGALIIAAAGCMTSRAMGRAAKVAVPRIVPGVAFVWGIAWWLYAARHDIEQFMAFDLREPAMVAVLGATSHVFSHLARRMDWREARWPALALPVTLVIAFGLQFRDKGHLFGGLGWAAWVFALVSLVEALQHHERFAWPAYRPVMHTLSALLLAGIIAVELHWYAALYAAPHSAWTIAAYAIGPCAVLTLLSARRADTAWPVRDNLHAYRIGAGVTLAASLLAWSVVANITHDGRSDPLPYMPVANALDLAHILAILCVTSLVMAWRRSSLDPLEDLRPPVRIAVAAIAFLWLNAILLRSLHHYAGIPYILGPMLASKLVQASLSIFWTSLALAVMLFATKRAGRVVWIAGAALLGVVVIKLFVLDLSHVTGVARIVSFIAVGVLMLLVGYFAPVPPRAAEAAS